MLLWAENEGGGIFFCAPLEVSEEKWVIMYLSVCSYRQAKVCVAY